MEFCHSRREPGPEYLGSRADTSVRICLDDLKRDGDVRIVNVASAEGVMATPNTSAYTVSEHGVVGLTRALAVKLGQWGVAANAVCPGPVRTAMTGFIPEEAKRTYARGRCRLAATGFLGKLPKSSCRWCSLPPRSSTAP